MSLTRKPDLDTDRYIGKTMWNAGRRRSSSHRERLQDHSAVQYSDLRHLAPWTVRKYFFVVWATQSAVLCCVALVNKGRVNQAKHDGNPEVEDMTSVLGGIKHIIRKRDNLNHGFSMSRICSCANGKEEKKEIRSSTRWHRPDKALSRVPWEPSVSFTEMSLSPLRPGCLHGSAHRPCLSAPSDSPLDCWVRQTYTKLECC